MGRCVGGVRRSSWIREVRDWVKIDHFRFRDEEQPAEVKRLIEKLVQRNPQQRLGLCQLLVNIKYELKKK
jgi:hypothetical protein